MPRSRLLHPLALLLILICAQLHPVSAQTVTGIVTVEDTGLPMTGALVVIVGADSVALGGAFTTPEGRYTLRLPEGGPFRMRARQLGHADAWSEPFAAADTVLRVDLALPVRAVVLDGLAAEAEGRCGVKPGEVDAVATVWQEVLKTLDAVRWTGRVQFVSYQVRKYERKLDRSRNVTSETLTTMSGSSARPFTTPPAENLVEQGFVQNSDNFWLFYAPDAVVLLSDVFAESHCFRVARDDSTAAVGLAFEPRKDQKKPDVAGTLWLDPETGGLRSLEYHYTNIDFGRGTDELGGRLEFMMLPWGAWITSRWVIRGPVLGRSRCRTFGRLNSCANGTIEGFIETGAEAIDIRPMGTRIR
jgi:hypothetical protein